MHTDTLRSFLEKDYPGIDKFLEQVIYRIFDKTELDPINKDDLADEENNIKLAHDTGIGRMELIGKIFVSGAWLRIYDVTVDSSVRMAHNRVNLQRLTRRIMHHNSAAFMVFHYDEAHATGREWRFSFCYKSSESEQTTDPKRFTFLLGPGHSCRTAANNFQELFKKKGQEVTIANLQEAFSVEALSEEFFDKYHKHYEHFVLHATGKRYDKQANKWEEDTEHAPDEAIMQAFGGDEKRVRDYVKKLLGRIVFLHFLQKKGWMGVPDGGRWGAGKLQFMSELFREATAEQQADFVHEVLEHLFFHALNTDRKADNDLYDTRVFGEKVRVPYLNGGLFEEDDADRCFKACTNAHFPAELFRELFTFFEQYNFTIDENDPDDAQVGVDPEMLGRIFESLLEDNKEKGAFYTPKEIVQYMCRRSLTAYLQADVPDERMRKKIDEFIRTKDYDCFHVQDDVPDERMPKAIDECVCTKDYDGLRQQIAERLRTVKICDPAIGSGAFPMGLLRELYLCRIALEDGVRENRAKSHAEIKKEILQQNIYGVDLDRGAVDIARLRFWLSLVVEEDVPQPLPNLDYKIMQGNSLLERYKEVDLSTLASQKTDGRLFFIDDENDASCLSLHHLLVAYYGEDNHDKKQSLRARIQQNIEEQLKAQRYEVDLSGVNVFANPNFFLWHTWFCVVFDKGGFDIVIGNPPYISLQNEGGSVGKPYEKADFSSFDRRGDIYCLFYEKGMQLLSPGGTLCFITSNKWMRAAYGEKLRGFLAEHTNPCLLIDFSGNKIFENATVDVNILLLEKAANAGQTEAVTLGKDFRLSAENLSLYVHQHATRTAFSSSESWVILSPIEQSIRRKIEAVGTPLKEWDISIYRGVLTGYNEAFIISTAKRDEILAACQTEDERQRTEAVIRPILRGKDIKRYGYDWAGQWLIATFPTRHYDIEQYPAVKQHLLSFGMERLEQTGRSYVINGEVVKARKKTSGKWFETQDSIAYWKDFEKPKVMWKIIGCNINFCFDEKQLICNNAVNIMIGRREHLVQFVGLMNSRLFDWYLKLTTEAEVQGGGIQLYVTTLEKTLLKLDFPKHLTDIIFQRIHGVVSDEVVDKAIFDAYELSIDERSFILQKVSRNREA